MKFISFTLVLLCFAALRAEVPASRPVADVFVGAMEYEARPFRPNSMLRSKRVYMRDGAKVGERTFYESGAVAIEVQLKDDKPEGMTRLFYPSGKLFALEPYRNGKLDGTVRYFKESGELMGESTLTDGTGTLRRFPLLGVSHAKEEITIKDGLKEGIGFGWLPTDDRGECFEIAEYVHGKLQGRCVVFDAQGRLVESSMTKHGLHGVWRLFGPDGKPEAGYPKYYIGSDVFGTQEVSEEAYREAAKTDPLLAQSLIDDNEQWGREIVAKRKATENDPTWLPTTVPANSAPIEKR